MNVHATQSLIQIERNNIPCPSDLKTYTSAQTVAKSETKCNSKSSFFGKRNHNKIRSIEVPKYYSKYAQTTV